jgi:hypothetical protein
MIKVEFDGVQLDQPLLRPLFNDMVVSAKLINESADGASFARRTFVRATFAFLEGQLYWLKEAVQNWLLARAWQTHQLEMTKLMLLDDQTYRPDRTGKIVSEASRIPFLNWCAFVYRTAAECWNVDAAKFFGDNGWNCLQSALDVRHRLAHPKRPEDLEVSDAELDAVGEAMRWSFNCLVAIVGSPDATKFLEAGASSSASP